MLDSSDKGTCKLCGEKKDFSHPIERLTRKEVTLVRALGNKVYYMQSGFNIDRKEYLW